MTLVQILQKLRDDLMAWSTANFEAVNQGFTSVNSKISSLQTSSSKDLTELKAQVDTNTTNIENNAKDIDDLETKTEYIDGTDDTALYIIDGNDNVIAYFDANGLHTTDIEAQTISVTEGIIQNGGEFFIVDGNDNVIAYFDAEGLHTTKISVTEGITQETDALYILDNNDNVITYINAEGTHTTNLFTTDIEYTKDSEGKVVKTTYNLNQELAKLNENKADHTDRIAELERKTEYLDASSNSTFFITDNEDNVIAYIDASGIHSINFYVEHNDDGKGTPDLDYTIRDKVIDLQNQINTEATTRQIKDEELYKTVNYIGSFDSNPTSGMTGGDLALINGVLKTYDSVSLTWIDHKGLAKKTEFFDIDYNDAFYITDANQNVIAKFDSQGLYVTDVITKGIKQKDDGTFEVIEAKDATDFYLNDTLVSILNKAINHANRITTIETRLNNVSNVMDFIGTFETEVDLYNYENPNNGDVAVVISNQKEYVYVVNENPDLTGWIEFGYSTSTANAIAKLQQVTGHTDGLDTDELDHHTRLTNLEAVVGHVNGLNSGESDHHTQLVELREDLDAEIDDRTNANRAVNYLGDFTNASEISNPELGDIAVINDYLKRYDGTNWQDFNGLSKKLYYLNGEASDKVYFVDGTSDEYVIAYIDSTGLHTTNLFASTDLSVEKNATIVGNTIVKGDTTLEKQLSVGDAATISGLTTINGNVTVGSVNNVGLKVTQGIVSDKLNTNSATIGPVSSTTTNLIVNGGTNITDALTVGKSATIGDGTDTVMLTVEGQEKITKDLEVDETLTVKKSATIGDNTDVLMLDVKGQTNVSKDLTVGELTTLNGSQTVDSVANVGLKVTNNAIIGNDLNVNNNLAINNGLAVSKTVQFGNVDSEATVTIRGNTTAQGKITSTSFETEEALITNSFNVDDGTNLTTINSTGIETTGTFKSKYLDATASDGFYFIDPNDNVGVYINNAGLHTNTLLANNLVTNNVSNPTSSLIYFDEENVETITINI